MKHITTFCIAGIFIFLTSCKKQEEDSCSDTPSPLTVSTNGPVTEGWPLIFDVSGYESGYGYTYRLTSPNGTFIEKPFNSSGTEAGMIQIDSASVNDSGNYKLELLLKGCLIKRGTVTVQVNPVPAPPCSIPDNSCTASISGSGNGSYYLISAESGFSYDVSAVTGNETIHLMFKQEPKPGMYTMAQGSSMEEDETYVYIQYGTYYSGMDVNTVVYVNKVNGKLQFTFCDGQFMNTANNPVTISAKITLP
jgi:hypothetical protein